MDIEDEDKSCIIKHEEGAAELISNVSTKKEYIYIYIVLQ